MEVIEIAERLRFEVKSTTRAGERRLVDMCQFNGNGECSCWLFAKQIRPQLEEHLKNFHGNEFQYIPEDRHQCDHIKAVNHYLANRLVQQVRKAYPDHNQEI